MTAPEHSGHGHSGHTPATYTVFVTGELTEGANLDQVKVSLAKLFKLAPERVDKIICGKPVAIRRGVDKAQAGKLVTALTKVGAMAAAKKSVAVGEKSRAQQLQGKQAGVQQAEEKHPQAVPVQKTRAAPSKAEPPKIKKSSITCPRCGHEQVFTTACGLCKMDLQLHIQRLARKEKIRAFQRQG